MKSFDTFNFVERLIIAALVVFVFSVLPACSRAEDMSDKDYNNARKVILRKGEKFIGAYQTYTHGMSIITTERQNGETPKCYTIYEDSSLLRMSAELRICEQ